MISKLRRLTIGAYKEVSVNSWAARSLQHQQIIAEAFKEEIPEPLVPIPEDQSKDAD